MKKLLSRALEEVLAASPHDVEILTLEQVKRVLQRAREGAQREQYRQEVQAALDNGFMEAELEELREVFQMLDADNSGSIDADEAWSTIKNLGFRLNKARFTAAYAKVDDDKSGSLEFCEYLKLLKLIRDGEECFAANRQITTLNKLLRSELLKVVAIFDEGFDVTKAESFTDPDLLAKVCKGFNVDPDTPVNKRMRLKTFQDLCAAATTIAEKDARRS